MSYKPFTGTKFRYTNTTIKYDEWNQPREVKNFEMTRSYIAYLQEKEEYENKLKLQTLRDKIDYQVKTYGSADKLDVDLYIALVQKYQSQLTLSREPKQAQRQEHQKAISNMRFSIPSKEHSDAKKAFTSMYTK